MTGYIGPIESQTLKNTDFRRVLFTGKHAQLVVMCLLPGEEIGKEVHTNVDQFFRIEQGEARFVLNEKEEHLLRDADAILYALKEVFGSAHGMPLTEANVFGALSLVFWTLVVVVSSKYVALIMRADNHGEGGILALLALVVRLTRENKRLRYVLGLLGVFGATLFYGDAVITPAISVLSAVKA